MLISQIATASSTVLDTRADAILAMIAPTDADVKEVDAIIDELERRNRDRNDPAANFHPGYGGAEGRFH